MAHQQDRAPLAGTGQPGVEADAEAGHGMEGHGHAGLAQVRAGTSATAVTPASAAAAVDVDDALQQRLHGRLAAGQPGQHRFLFFIHATVLAGTNSFTSFTSFTSFSSFSSFSCMPLVLRTAGPVDDSTIANVIRSCNTYCKHVKPMKSSKPATPDDATLLDRLARRGGHADGAGTRTGGRAGRGYPHAAGIGHRAGRAARHQRLDRGQAVRQAGLRQLCRRAARSARQRDGGAAHRRPARARRHRRQAHAARLLDDALRHDQHNLAATHESLDLAAFGAIAHLLATAKGRIFVLAQKNSAPVSAAGAAPEHVPARRARARRRCGHADRRRALASPDDVLLAFSIRRYSRAPVSIARVFRAQGARVVALCDSPAAPLVPLADHHLLVRTANASPFDSYTAAFFLCNALVSAVVQLRKPATIDALQRRDALWEAFASDTVESTRKG